MYLYLLKQLIYSDRMSGERNIHRREIIKGLVYTTVAAAAMTGIMLTCQLRTGDYNKVVVQVDKSGHKVYVDHFKISNGSTGYINMRPYDSTKDVCDGSIYFEKGGIKLSLPEKEFDKFTRELDDQMDITEVRCEQDLSKSNEAPPTQ